MSNAHTSKMLGRYELLFLLGQGGMGEVHLARLTGVGGFEKLCIVKTILPQMQADPQFVDRFHHEARVLVHLTHSNIAQVYDMGDVDHTLYMAIEYVAGVDLSRVQSRVISSGTVLPLPISLYIGQQIAEALGYAHRKIGPDGISLGIVHRDVSPQNVMVSYEGEVKVIDFGLAKSKARSKHTLPSTVMGKLGYMSPEQAMARMVDSRSDTFSAGIVVWEMIAGRPLYEGGTMGEMVVMMGNPRIPSLQSVRPEVSPALDQIVMRALAVDPAQRYARCDEFARALNELAVREGLTIGAEDVGNAIRGLCSEEYAAERQLQSKLSLLRRKNAAGKLEEPHVPGTFLRGSDEAPLTPAQKALSAVETPAPLQLNQMQLSGPSEVVASGEMRVSGEVKTAPEDSMDIIVPKNRTPMVVLAVLGLLAVAGLGAYIVNERVPAAGNEAAPPPGPVAGAAPKNVKTPSQMVREPIDKGHTVAGRERVEPTGPLFRVSEIDGEFVMRFDKKPVSFGDIVRLVGPVVEGKKRELYGTAVVIKVKGSLAQLMLDGSSAGFPEELMAYHDVGAGKKLNPTKLPDKDTGGWSSPPVFASNTGGGAGGGGEAAGSPAPKPVETAAATAPAPHAAASGDRRTIAGVVSLTRRQGSWNAADGAVAIMTDEKTVLTGCWVWLPDGRSHWVKTLEPGRNTIIGNDVFKPDSRKVLPDMVKFSVALVQCEPNAVGYFRFRALDR